MCKHTTMEKIPCDPELSQLAGGCLNNTLNEMRHGACPKCSGAAATAVKPKTYIDRQENERPSSSKAETDDLMKALSAQGKRTMGNIKKLVKSVSKKTISNKSSEAAAGVEIPSESEGAPERDEGKSKPMTSEQWAQEYRNLIGKHPLEEDSEEEEPEYQSSPVAVQSHSGYQPSPVAAQSPDVETGTTWSGLMRAGEGVEGEMSWVGKDGKLK